MIGIYKITSPTNKIYIGQSENIERRFMEYKRLSCKKQRRLIHSFEKHEVENHIFEIVEECESDQLNIRERYWQEYYNVIDQNKGLNCAYVKVNSKKATLSEETRELRSKQMQEYWKQNPHPFLNKKHSEETKNKISKSNSKPNIKMQGVIKTEEHREKISVTLSGRTSPRKGIKNIYTEEQIEHLRELAKNRDFTPKNLLNLQTGIYYNSIKEAAQSCNMSMKRLKRLVLKENNPTPFIYV